MPCWVAATTIAKYSHLCFIVVTKLQLVAVNDAPYPLVPNNSPVSPLDGPAILLSVCCSCCILRPPPCSTAHRCRLRDHIVGALQTVVDCKLIEPRDHSAILLLTAHVEPSNKSIPRRMHMSHNAMAKYLQTFTVHRHRSSTVLQME